MAHVARERGTAVVDITYVCNAACRYCRWGDGATPGRAAQDLDKVLIPAGALKALGTRRVVISGGEPRLHPRLSDILGYYGGLVDEVVVITNGYGLDASQVGTLLDWGATGITISLDSTNAAESFATRRTPPAIHRDILRNLEDMAGPGRRFELGINSTVTRITANWITVSDLLGFGAGLDFVKFQPVFDDGYVSATSPDMLLCPEDAASLRDIASRVGAAGGPPTNPPGFWRDVAALAAGASLPASGCALGPRDAISVGGQLGICYWVESSRYGSPGMVPREGYGVAASAFGEAKKRCRVGFHCFCNQGLDHVWRTDA